MARVGQIDWDARCVKLRRCSPREWLFVILACFDRFMSARGMQKSRAEELFALIPYLSCCARSLHDRIYFYFYSKPCFPFSCERRDCRSDRVPAKKKVRARPPDSRAVAAPSHHRKSCASLPLLREILSPPPSHPTVIAKSRHIHRTSPACGYSRPNPLIPARFPGFHCSAQFMAGFRSRGDQRHARDTSDIICQTRC